MVYVIPQTFDVKRRFTAFGHVYDPGSTIDGPTLARIRSADVLLSRKFVIPTPDPHSRDTKPEHPTPTALPATVRQNLINLPKEEGTITVTYDTDPGDELRVTFDASFSGPAVWDYGDGGGTVQGDSHTTRTYGAPGTYQVTATSGTHTGTVSVTVPQVVEEEPEPEAAPAPARRASRTRKAKEE